MDFDRGKGPQKFYTLHVSQTETWFHFSEQCKTGGVVRISYGLVTSSTGYKGIKYPGVVMVRETKVDVGKVVPSLWSYLGPTPVCCP